MLQPITADLDSWFRLGHGHMFQFYATDDEVQNWLLSVLPEAYAPYRLVGTDLIKEGRVYVEHPFSCELAGFLQCRYALAEPRWDFWLLSTVLTPDLPLATGPLLTNMYSFNGLINLQHASMLEDPVHRTRPLAKNECSLGLVDRVYRVDSDEVRQHEAYLRLFNTVKRAIRKSLIYTTIPIWPDDVEGAPESSPLWTEGARREYESGIPYFRARPGPPRAELKQPTKHSSRE
jgi:hypothetical protein